MKAPNKWLTAPLAAGLSAALLSGCGTEQGSGSGGSGGVRVGMSDEILSPDPAAGYDPGSWLLFNNVFQSLLAFPKGGSEPEPEAAEKCGFAPGSRVYTCTLRDGLTFSNGNKLTSEDVKYSFERSLRIADPSGPAPLLSTIDTIETPDERTVVFRLKVPDATFPSKIASGAGSIVDHREYPADALRTDGRATGSGPYKLDSFSDTQATFSANTGYKGTARPKNDAVTLKLYRGDRSALSKAFADGDVDVAYRGLSADDIAALETSDTTDDKGIEVTQGSSAEVQHLVFNMKDPVLGKLGVRKAIAHLVDREALVENVYKSTATPLYSIVPAGIAGHNTAFYDTYGTPDKAKAKQALRSAGITDKVELTLWSTPSRYGPATDQELKAIAGQLNESGLFDADVKSVAFDQYEKDIAAGKYGVYVKGWVPDYPDADNFTAPFFGEGNVLGNHYENAAITAGLLPRTAAAADRAATADEYGKLQDLVAEDLPLLPLWQGKQYAVARDDVTGLEWTLDASTVFRFWEIRKG
ncbi:MULTISPECIES: ABC transporter substrate-binding protein [unclassified Streptomyces]|uniref:ABC transporter substrate-binding protein n=1 Tax=unclassified Streptomyces TaxID=2593676 RepID=UPI0006FFAED4|nr:MULTISPECIES: ABC transporter substrate-binding protein [unclassified Streptomyces]KQX47852.1 ABC transporter substrate-binding protein [Streptomyces sp. Root1304]KRA82244.1 ABC transporter substrate-binding protein [Streptomyces sp. Root66D1]